MKTSISISISLLVLLFSSCEYDSYISDFDYTTAYFAYQNPVRTVFSDDLKIEVGVVMGGKRENKVAETVKYRIAPELLSDASIVRNNKFTLLPADYYKLSNANEITIPVGDFVGKVTLELDTEKFLHDPLATQRTYALPLLITETSLDSVLRGDVANNIARKDYTVIVIKYISKFHGIYYHRGLREKYDTSGSLVDVLRYVTEEQEEEYVANIVWNLHTVDARTLLTNGLGEHNTANNKTYGLTLSLENGNTVSISAIPESEITDIQDLGNSRYDEKSKSFYLNYQYTDTENSKFVMKDTLIFRNDGLKLELW